jgi:hypothetical protein
MLGRQRFAGFPDLMSMMEVLHRLFQANGYQQPNNDGCNMDEEVFPGADRLVEWTSSMDAETSGL